MLPATKEHAQVFSLKDAAAGQMKPASLHHYDSGDGPECG